MYSCEIVNGVLNSSRINLFLLSDYLLLIVEQEFCPLIDKVSSSDVRPCHLSHRMTEPLFDHSLFIVTVIVEIKTNTRYLSFLYYSQYRF